MPSSLEPLSSPSPSPPPSLARQHTRASTSNNSGAGAGLDSGSELSELTEDEQETVNSKSDREEPARPSRRGRKRGGIVPAPMWDWAYKNNKKDVKPKMLEEEEEEEQMTPAKMVQEEEDIDERSQSRSGASPLPERRRKRKSSAALQIDDDDEDDEPALGSDLDEDDEASIDAVSAVHAADDAVNDPDYVSEDEEDRPATVVGARDARRTASRGASAEATDEENVDDDDVEPEPDVDVPDDEDVGDAPPADESDDEDGADDAPLVVAPSAVPGSLLTSTTASTTVNDSIDPDATLTLMDVDISAPAPEQVSPIIAAAAASSIMAGSSVIAPASPSPSTSSAASGSARNQSPVSSRSPSPEPLSDREPDVKRGSVRTRAVRPRSGRAARNKSRRKTKLDTTLDNDADQDQPDGDAERDNDIDDGGADSPELDVELDLQPAHRAEALDVLATIELKYALLRESLYIEKIESLAWEEALVAEGIHPEMLHLHTELSKRRDKRLELATLRRDYEVANVTKRRKLDEDGVWSWWKLRRDELQTQMISETNRKRRKLDRERRALDRPQPVRRIPSPPREIALAPPLRELIKTAPLDIPEYKKHQLPESALAYPQLSTLSPADIVIDLNFLAEHRRLMPGMNAVHPAMMNMNPMMGGHPVPPIGYDQYGVGMGPVGMHDVGVGHRFPHAPFQQQMPQPPMPGQIIQGYPGPAGPSVPRLQHHHSTPSGAPLPGPHTQMLIEQEVGPLNRAGASAPQNAHILQYGAPIPANFMRRSISPVAIQPGNNGVSTLPSGKTNSRMNTNVSGPSSQSGKELKRIASGARPMDIDGFDRERDRDRYQDGLKSREKDDRARDFHAERERELIYERERDRARERDRERESDRELDRTGHGPLPVQRISSHQHPLHLHPSSSQAGHHHPHHHHHHHHVHHHHHPNAPNGPVSVTATGQTSSITALHSSNDLASRNASPHSSRELDRRAHSSAPVEVIDLSSAKSAAGPMSTWKNNDEPGEIHERAKLTGPAPRDRAMPPSYPSSPRTGPGPSTAPASMAPSRRGSWSAPDDGSLPRPSSSASSHLVGASSSGPQRLPPALNSTPRTQMSPSLPSQRSPPMISPSRHTSIRLPPLSPSVGAIPRSPLRPSQALPSTLPPIPTSSKSTSPKILRRSPPPLNRPKSPGAVRDMHGPPLSSSKVPPSSPSANLFSMSHSHASLSGSRLSNVGAGSESSLPSPPKVNPLPID